MERTLKEYPECCITIVAKITVGWIKLSLLTLSEQNYVAVVARKSLETRKRLTQGFSGRQGKRQRLTQGLSLFRYHESSYRVEAIWNTESQL